MSARQKNTCINCGRFTQFAYKIETIVFDDEGGFYEKNYICEDCHTLIEKKNKIPVLKYRKPPDIDYTPKEKSNRNKARALKMPVQHGEIFSDKEIELRCDHLLASKNNTHIGLEGLTILRNLVESRMKKKAAKDAEIKAAQDAEIAEAKARGDKIMKDAAEARRKAAAAKSADKARENRNIAAKKNKENIEAAEAAEAERSKQAAIWAQYEDDLKEWEEKQAADKEAEEKEAAKEKKADEQHQQLLAALQTLNVSQGEQKDDELQERHNDILNNFERLKKQINSIEKKQAEDKIERMKELESQKRKSLTKEREKRLQQLEKLTPTRPNNPRTGSSPLGKRITSPSDLSPEQKSETEQKTDTEKLVEDIDAQASAALLRATIAEAAPTPKDIDITTPENTPDSSQKKEDTPKLRIN